MGNSLPDRHNEQFLSPGFISCFEHQQPRQPGNYAILHQTEFGLSKSLFLKIHIIWPSYSRIRTIVLLAYRRRPTLETLSHCHARKIQSPPDKRRRSILICRARNEHRDRAKTKNTSTHLCKNGKTSYFCPGYSRPASSWRRQPTRADPLGANLQTGYLRTSRPTCFPVSDRT